MAFPDLLTELLFTALHRTSDSCSLTRATFVTFLLKQPKLSHALAVRLQSCKGNSHVEVRTHQGYFGGKARVDAGCQGASSFPQDTHLSLLVPGSGLRSSPCCFPPLMSEAVADPTGPEVCVDKTVALSLTCCGLPLRKELRCARAAKQQGFHKRHRESSREPDNMHKTVPTGRETEAQSRWP